MSEEQQAVEEQVIPESTVLGSDTAYDNLDWKSSLPSELANDPTILQFKDIESLAKTVIHQQKQMGSRIPLPKNDDEYNELYNKLGRPEDASKYKTKIPEGMDSYFEENTLNEFKNVAHQIGLNQKQLDALIEYQTKSIQYSLEKQPAVLSAQKNETEQNLKQEWGIDYDKKIRAAQRGLQVYGDPEIAELMNTAAGNNPAVVKLFARLGAEVTEDMTQNTQNNNLAISRLDAKDEIEQIFTNYDHPYFNGKHPEHKSAVERVRQLHEKVHGTS
jgi:hypothetical protein